MKLLVLSAALIFPASAPEAPASSDPARPAPRPMHVPAPPLPERARMPNAFSVGGPNCRSVVHQIQGEEARLRGITPRTLDREPTAHGFLAVDRNVGGCREVTFLNGRGPPPRR